MTAQQAIDAARTRIGLSAEDDYVLVPEKHAEDYADTGLASILTRSEMTSIIGRYRKSDSAAIAAQHAFKRVSGVANVSLFLATAASSSIMISVLFFEEPLRNHYTTGGALAGFILATIAGVCLTMIRSGKLLARWMESRSRAEMLRIRYFKLVTSAAEAPGTDSSLALLILEYFRRFQVEIQVSYYRVRGRGHASSARSAMVWSAVAMGVVSLANASAGWLVLTHPNWSALAALALIAQALATSASNSESLNQDARNAERYGRVYRGLDKLAGHLDEVRMSVATDHPALLASFVDAFHEGLSAEHRQWTEDVGDIGSAVDRLRSQLKAAASRLGHPATHREPGDRG